MNEHEQLVDRAARHAHTVVFLGGLDAGAAIGADPGDWRAWLKDHPEPRLAARK